MKYYTYNDWIVQRKDDWKEGDPQSFIPPTEDNLEYRTYLEWVKEGNETGVIEDE